MKEEQRLLVIRAFERIITDVSYLRDLIFAPVVLEDDTAIPADRVRITAQPRLRVRLEPNIDAAIVGHVNHGIEVELKERRDGWGRIDDPAGWIDLTWTEPA